MPKTHGPVHPRRFHFTTRDIARALIEVGLGQSYRAAAQAARLHAMRGVSVYEHGGVIPIHWGNLVADWVEVFAPVVFEPYRPLEWPSVIAIDELPYSVSSGKQGGQRVFVIFGAVGYKAGKAELLKLEASPRATSAAWAELLGSLDGIPKRVVCDHSNAILKAVKTAWPGSPPTITLCRHHLREVIQKKVPIAKEWQPGAPLGDTIGSAFRDEVHWDTFVQAARAGNYQALHKWLDTMDAVVREQLKQGGHPNSTGAVEEVFTALGGRIGERYGRLRNRQRLNRLLMLMQLELKRQRNEERYARLIRDALDSEGFPPLRHQILDPIGTSSLWAA